MKSTITKSTIMKNIKSEKVERKIVQVSSNENCSDYTSVFALCNDGSVWEYMWGMSAKNSRWRKLKDIPQDEKKENENEIVNDADC